MSLNIAPYCKPSVLSFFLVVFCCGCSGAQGDIADIQASPEASDSLAPAEASTLFPIDTSWSEANYSSIRESARRLRNELRAAESDDWDSAGMLFENFMLNQIIPCWYGTPWDFDGYTSRPRDGVIACGYFISTTLQHMGLKLDRYAMAKQWPIDEARTLAMEEPVVSLGGISVEALSDSLRHYPDGLYFLGLSNHVTFLLLKDSSQVVLHSDYVQGRVRAEYLLESAAVASSQAFHLVAISRNEELMKVWVEGQELRVMRLEKE